MLVSSPNTTTITDHKLGSTLAYLGFPCSFAATIHESTRQKHIQFFFESHSIRFPSLPDLHTLLKQSHGGDMPDPHHVMSVCTRAHRNYDAILRWQKEGDQQRLHPVGNLAAYEYKAGSPWPDIGTRFKHLDHLQLAAALGEIGFQVSSILGNDRARTYGLPFVGLQLFDSAGQSLRYDLYTVTQLAPTADDPRRLALEVSQPMHPLVIAYNALRCRALLKKQIDAERAKLLIEDGGRQALIGMNATGHTMDHVTAHFKSPPLG
jgi:hypothetical protein